MGVFAAALAACIPDRQAVIVAGSPAVSGAGVPRFCVLPNLCIGPSQHSVKVKLPGVDANRQRQHQVIAKRARSVLTILITIAASGGSVQQRLSDAAPLQRLTCAGGAADKLYSLYGMKYILVLVLFILSFGVAADSWSPAKIAGYSSPTGKFVVRIVPGSNLDAVYGFSGAQKGSAATALLYRIDSAANYSKYREITLLNPIAPEVAAVSDAGEIVTLDNWHNMGIGSAVVAVYSPDGAVLRNYSLADIFTAAEINQFERTTSSVWWRCHSQPVFEPRTNTLELLNSLGENLAINLKTGLVTRRQTSQKGC